MTGRHARPVLPGGPGSRRIFKALGMTVLGALVGTVGVGGLWGLVGGVTVGLACAWWVWRRPSPEKRAQEDRFTVELPFAVDLVAAALRAGAPPQTAAQCVADALDGAVGERLRAVARALRLGEPTGEAWSLLGGGEAESRVARAAQRSGHSGAALAGALDRVADDLRNDAVLAAEARARTAGVLIVLPLGLCFLPAFVFTGLVPVIVAVVGGVLTTEPPP